MLGSIPIYPDIAETCDRGHAFIEQFTASSTAAIMQEVIEKVLELHQPEMPAARLGDAKRTPEDQAVGANGDTLERVTEFG